MPQGSTLGPLLFIIYINDHPNIFKNSKAILFADDTVIFHPVTDNFNDSYQLLQDDLKLLHLWCQDNLLVVNTGKTKVSYFSSKYLNTTTKPYKKLTLGGSGLEYVDKYKYLGLIIDTKLSFSSHLTTMLKTVSNRITQLKRIRNSITHKIALQLYKSMILPIIDYADIFCHNKNSVLLKKFQTLQNRCIRIISRLPRLSSTADETKKLGLLPLHTRRSLHILQFGFELINSDASLVDEAVQPREQTRTRNPLRTQFNIFRPRKALIEKSISYVLRKNWNNLPTIAHQIEDKNILANFLLANPNFLEF